MESLLSKIVKFKRLDDNQQITTYNFQLFDELRKNKLDFMKNPINNNEILKTTAYYIVLISFHALDKLDSKRPFIQWNKFIEDIVINANKETEFKLSNDSDHSKSFGISCKNEWNPLLDSNYRNLGPYYDFMNIFGKCANIDIKNFNYLLNPYFDDIFNKIGIKYNGCFEYENKKYYNDIYHQIKFSGSIVWYGEEIIPLPILSQEVILTETTLSEPKKYVNAWEVSLLKRSGSSNDSISNQDINSQKENINPQKENINPQERNINPRERNINPQEQDICKNTILKSDIRKKSDLEMLEEVINKIYINTINNNDSDSDVNEELLLNLKNIKNIIKENNLNEIIDKKLQEIENIKIDLHDKEKIFLETKKTLKIHEEELIKLINHRNCLIIEKESTNKVENKVENNDDKIVEIAEETVEAVIVEEAVVVIEEVEAVEVVEVEAVEVEVEAVVAVEAVEAVEAVGTEIVEENKVDKNNDEKLEDNQNKDSDAKQKKKRVYKKIN